MNNVRIPLVLLIFMIVGGGALTYFAAETRNWTLLVLIGYGTMMLLAVVLLAGIRYLSRKVRTEGRNSRGEVELLHEATVAMQGSLERNGAQLDDAMELITSKLDSNGTAISRQRKELKTAAASTTEAISAHEKTLKEEFGALSLAAKQLEVAERHLVALKSHCSDLKGEISNRMRELEKATFTELKDAKNELLTRLRETERKLVANTPKTNDIKRIRERLETAESRILGTLESEAFQHGATMHDHTQAVEKLETELESLATLLAEPEGRNSIDATPVESTDVSQLQGMVSTLRKHITTTVRDGTRQVESLIQLAPHFSGKKMPLPSTGDFAIDAQALAHLITLVEEQRPKRILELGSGTSTVWLGYLCKSYGGKLVTLDHLDEYLEQTKAAVERHELCDEVEVRRAPLEELECQGQIYNWYSKSSLEGLTDIDLLVIDGPPAATGKMARYPALPMLVAQLSAHATVVLDDAHRDEEASIVAGWLEHFPEFRSRESGASRLAVLQRGSQ